MFLKIKKERYDCTDDNITRTMNYILTNQMRIRTHVYICAIVTFYYFSDSEILFHNKFEFNFWKQLYLRK
jgi:hypothetical protein